MSLAPWAKAGDGGCCGVASTVAAQVAIAFANEDVRRVKEQPARKADGKADITKAKLPANQRDQPKIELLKEEDMPTCAAAVGDDDVAPSKGEGAEVL